MVEGRGEREPREVAAVSFEEVGLVFGAGAEGDPGFRALEGISFSVGPGERVALVGPSGSGKTSLLRLVNALVPASEGRVCVRGRPVQEQDPVALRRSLGWVVQRGGLFPHLTARENIALPAKAAGDDARELPARIDELLLKVHLDPSEFGGRYPKELSGGQRARVAIARALVRDSDLVLMDEPFGALDERTRRALQDECLALSERLGPAIVLVTHDLEEAFRLGQRVAVLERGRLLAIGTREELEAAPQGDPVRAFLAGGRGALEGAPS